MRNSIICLLSHFQSLQIILLCIVLLFFQKFIWQNVKMLQLSKSDLYVYCTTIYHFFAKKYTWNTESNFLWTKFLPLNFSKYSRFPQNCVYFVNAFAEPFQFLNVFCRFLNVILNPIFYRIGKYTPLHIHLNMCNWKLILRLIYCC